MNYAIFSLRLYVTILLALTAVVGDGLVSHSKIKVYQALFDNVTHSVIGGLSWLLVCIYCRNISYRIIVEVITCAVIASIIDLDHFLIAKSLHLEVKSLFKIITLLKYYISGCNKPQSETTTSLFNIPNNFMHVSFVN